MNNKTQKTKNYYLVYKKSRGTPRIVRDKQQLKSAINRVAKKLESILKWERTATVFYVLKSELVTSKVPSGGIYTTACSFDVCNIPTKGRFFFFSQ